MIVQVLAEQVPALANSLASVLKHLYHEIPEELGQEWGLGRQPGRVRGLAWGLGVVWKLHCRCHISTHQHKSQTPKMDPQQAAGCQEMLLSLAVSPC